MMFGLDCLNIIILAIILSGYRSQQACGAYFATLSSIAVFFWAAFVASIILLIGGLLLINSLGAGNLRAMLTISTALVTCGYSSEAGISGMAAMFVIIGLFLKAGIGPFFI